MTDYGIYLKYYGPNLLAEEEEEFIAWGWEDIHSQRALAAKERNQLRIYVNEAEEMFDFDDLDPGEIVARIWIDGGIIGPVKWLQKV